MLLATATAGGSGGATALLLLVAATGSFNLVAADRSRSRYRPPGWKEVAVSQSKPQPQQVSLAVREPYREPAREPVREPYREPVREPYREPYREPVREPYREPVREPYREPVREPYREPVREPYREPAREVYREPVREPVRQVSRPRPRVRQTTPAPVQSYYDYSDYSDYSDDYRRPVTTVRPRSRSRSRTVSRVTTKAPVARYDYEDDYYSDYSEPRRPPSPSTFPPRGRSVENRGQEQLISPARRKEETARRNQLFLQNKDRYCNPADLPDVLSSLDQDPSLITVTHLVGNAIWGLGATSVELVPVAKLQSTDISSSPLIYYSASTATDSIVFSGLVANPQEEVVVRPTCVLGRSTLVQDSTTRNQYTVNPVTQQLLLPGLDQPDLTQLLLSLLAKDMVKDLSSRPGILLPSQATPIIPNIATSLVTSISTLSSTYLTTLTETDTSLISLTFRGKEVVTTLTSTSTHEVVATEFSVSTIITPAIITALPGPSTALPLFLPSLPNPATPALPASTFLVTMTNTLLHTETQEQTTVIPLTFRGKAISTTLTGFSVVTLTETSLSTETRTHLTPSPAQAPAQDLAVLAPLLQDLGLSYGDLDLELVSLLLTPPITAPLTQTEHPTESSNIPKGTDLWDTIDSDLWDGIVLSGKNF